MRWVFRWLRLGALLTLLTAAAVLNRWSHIGDPRFYAFLRTPLGGAIAGLFGWWRSPLETPSPRKGDHRLTETERQVKADIEAALRGPGSSAVGPLPEVTYRDVAFRLEFPEVPLYVHAPFAILSDAPRTDVSALISTLADTHRWFHPLFQPLFTQAYRADLIHVLYFSEQERYERYQREHAEELDNTAGFYSPAVNRLVLYRHPDAGLDAGEGSLQTLYTIRHEATHLFLFSYGVHSYHRIENEWLIEGLACLAEVSATGEENRRRAQVLQGAAADDALIPLEELVNHRDERVRLLGYSTTELAYSQSWALVRFLMQDVYREAFFNYIRYVRDPAHFAEVRRRDRMDLLAEFVDLTPEDLEAAWRDSLGRL